MVYAASLMTFLYLLSAAGRLKQNRPHQPTSLSQPSPSPKTLETPSPLLSCQGRNPTASWQLLPCTCTPETPALATPQELLFWATTRHSASTSCLTPSHRLWAPLQAHKITEVPMLIIYKGPTTSCTGPRDNVVFCRQSGKTMSHPIPWKTLCLMSLPVSWEMLKLHIQMHTRCSP